MTKALIRDDGVVYAYHPDWAKLPNFRLYTGPLPCSHAEGRKWLEERTGQTASPVSAGPSIPQPPAPQPVQAGPEVTQPAPAVLPTAGPVVIPPAIDLSKATREEMVQYAEKYLNRKFPAGFPDDMIRNRIADQLGIESPAEVTATDIP